MLAVIAFNIKGANWKRKSNKKKFLTKEKNFKIQSNLSKTEIFK